MTIVEEVVVAHSKGVISFFGKFGRAKVSDSFFFFFFCLCQIKK